MEDWFKKYEEVLKISGRNETFKKALELFMERGGQIICETGTQRMKNDVGGGQSTLIFGDLCKTFNKHLFTVDINHEAIEVAKEVIEEANIPQEMITYVENDSIPFLENFNQTIDLLYLDSLDAPEYDSPESLNLIQSQVHQLREIEAALDKLSSDAIVLLDDNDPNQAFPTGGKTKLAKFFLKDHGFKEIAQGKQSLWMRK